MFINTLIAH